MLRFKLRDRGEIMETLEKDIMILKNHNIMDYSLLFAIEKNANYKGI